MSIRTVETRLVICDGELHSGLACAKQIDCGDGVPDEWFSLSYRRARDSGWAYTERGGHFCSLARLTRHIERCADVQRG